MGTRMLKKSNSKFSAEEQEEEREEDLDPYYKAQALYGNKGGKEENSTFSAEEEEREHLDPYIKRRALYRNKTAQNSIFSAEVLSGLIANLIAITARMLSLEPYYQLIQQHTH